MKLLAALCATILAGGCASSSSSEEMKDPHDLDGTWAEVTAGVAASSTTDAELATYTMREAGTWELTLSNGSGTLTLTDKSTPASPCVVSRDVTVTANADGSGSTTEGGTGTLLSGPAQECAGDVGFGFFGAGTTALTRVSRNGDRLVLMGSSATSSGLFTFIVYARK